MQAQVPLTEAAGQTAGAFINLYPPGIPIVAPGEQITQEAVDVITPVSYTHLYRACWIKWITWNS